MTIAEVIGRRVWDSRGRPTVEVEVVTSAGRRGRGIAPAGASTGSREAVDRRDGGDRLGGYDVSGAVAAVATTVAPALIGRDVTDQVGVDAALDALDPSPTRSTLGGNVTVAASLATLHAAAAVREVPLWRCLADTATTLPRPEIQILGGGAHAGRVVDVQDFMVVPLSAQTFDEALEQVAEVYLAAGRILRDRGRACGVADEGGHWPSVASNEDALRLLTEAIEAAGFTPGADVAISLDLAASEFEQGGRYTLSSEGRRLERAEWIALVADWVHRYPVVAVEDPAGEHDLEGLVQATALLADRCLVIGDDAVVTDAATVRTLAAAGACNAALVKVNQAGTVTAAAAAVAAARAAGWSVIVSARSGETEDVSVAHLAVGWHADLVKVGSITRGERTAKWNELLRISEAAGGLPLAPLPVAQRAR
jgi:enolase